MAEQAAWDPLHPNLEPFWLPFQSFLILCHFFILHFSQSPIAEFPMGVAMSNTGHWGGAGLEGR